VEKISVSFPVIYGLSIEQIQQLGLYISHPRSPQEAAYLFAHPELETLVSGLEFFCNPDNAYPIRGIYE
jgi:hypothetical protein